MTLHRYLSAAAGVALSASGMLAQSKPTVAIMYFNDGAIGKAHDELAPLSKGICDVLISEMSGNPAIKVVERDQLENVLKEQRLGPAGTTDQATAVKIGKLLSAHHMIFGGFVTNPAGTMNLNLRAVNVETGEIEFTTNASDKTANLFDLIRRVAAMTNAGLKLPDIPRDVGEARKPGSEQIPFQAVMLYSKALEMKDAGKKSEAITLFTQVSNQFPVFDAPKKELAKLK